MIGGMTSGARDFGDSGCRGDVGLALICSAMCGEPDVSSCDLSSSVRLDLLPKYSPKSCCLHPPGALVERS